VGTATDSVLASLKVTVADSSVNGNGSAVDETAAASREYCATSSRDRRGLDRADAKAVQRQAERSLVQSFKQCHLKK